MTANSLDMDEAFESIAQRVWTQLRGKPQRALIPCLRRSAQTFVRATDCAISCNTTDIPSAHKGTGH